MPISTYVDLQGLSYVCDSHLSLSYERYVIFVVFVSYISGCDWLKICGTFRAEMKYWQQYELPTHLFQGHFAHSRSETKHSLCEKCMWDITLVYRVCRQVIQLVFLWHIHKEKREGANSHPKHNFICVQSSYMFPLYIAVIRLHKINCNAGWATKK